VKVAAVTPVDAARDPAHPDHDRWVKETTLKMEVDHAKAVGLPLRHAEAENLRLLERSERIASDSKPVAEPRRKPARERIADKGVTVRAAKPEISILKMSPCGRCGTCRNCMRERRVLLIMQKRKDDKFLAQIAAGLVCAAMRMGKYANLSKRDYDRAVAATAEAACEASIPRLGKWI
jgi:hypothetical protein